MPLEADAGPRRAFCQRDLALRSKTAWARGAASAAPRWCFNSSAVIGALILGRVAGFLGKALMPGEDPGGFLATIGLGLAGAAVGWLIFTLGLGIGDDDMFDLGGLVGAIIGVMILLGIYRWWTGRRSGEAQPT
jgi:uncharacterized membrane protein YeaQ/YmgE (transglycosylase-associated protein family)